VGARELMAAAASLEAALREEREDDATLRSFVEELGRTRDVLARLEEVDTVTVGETRPVDPEAVTASLGDLEASLEEDVVAALERVESLEETLRGTPHEALARTMRDRAEQFDLDGVREAAAELRRAL
jgi:hypothetical protein